MRQRTLLVLGILMMATLLPAGEAQEVVGPSPRLVDSGVSHEPVVVGVLVDSVVRVWNPSTNPRTVTLTWSWGDGRPLNEAQVAGPYNQQQHFLDPESNTTVRFPFKPDERHAGEQTIVVKLTEAGQGQGGPNTTATRKVFVANASLNLTLDGTASNATLDSGVGFFKFYVRNDGNVPDTPRLHITSDPNFNLTVLGNFSPIPPGQSSAGQVLVRPLTSNESINLTANLSAESLLNPAVNVTVPVLPVHVNASLVLLNHSVTVSQLPSVAQVLSGANRTLHATLTNTGDADDVYNVTLNVTPAGSGMNATLALSGKGNLSRPPNGTFTVGLRPRESLTLAVVLRYNASVGGGNATLALNVTSVNADLLAARHPAILDGASTSTRLAPAGPAPAIVGIAGRADLYPDETGQLTVSVANRGIVPSRPGVVKAVVEDNLRSVSEVTLQVPALAPDQTADLRLALPLVGLRGAYVLAATLVPNAADTDADASDNFASLPFYVRAPVFDLNAPTEVTLTPGAVLSLLGGPRSVSIANSGDQEETFVVTLSSPSSPWLDASWTVAVPRGVTRTIPLNITVPHHVGAQILTARVRAEILGHPAYADEKEIRLETEPIGGAAIDFAPLAPGVARRAQTLSARIQDAIGVSYAEARLTTPTGAIEVVPLAESGPDLWSASYTPWAAGAYAVEVFVASEGEPLRTSNLTQPWRVDPASYAGIAPRGFQDGDVIGNTTLAFDEREPGTTRAFTVDVGAGPQALAYPYRIDASFWKDGPHRIELHATSVDGVTWNETLDVTLDRTPPRLAEASSSAGQGGTLELSVRADGASRVVARIATPRGPIDVPLSKSTAGEYRASVLAPEEWASVTFVATGKNGIESALVVPHESGGLSIPLGGWIAVLAGLLAALLVARRRG